MGAAGQFDKICFFLFKTRFRVLNKKRHLKELDLDCFHHFCIGKKKKSVYDLIRTE